MSLFSSLARAALDWKHDRDFDRTPGAYRGVFRSFEEAKAAAPSTRIGFDFSELANLYDDRQKRVFPSDYPVLFWLRELLLTERRLFDFGGHVGVSFYAYQRLLELAPDFHWHVCDVPEIAKAGRALAAERGESRLTFSSSFAGVAEFDLLLAAGSLQFLEAPLAAMLGELAHRPRHVLVNKLPLHPAESFVTLQNTVHSYNPYRIHQRDLFVGGMTALGYETVDAWQNADLFCRIPRHPRHGISAYSGFYFRRTG